ncbi:MAG TPA: hypothetical protein VGM37_06115 [Armatimonadota bacterium]|jgi:hypothetical protein
MNPETSFYPWVTDWRSVVEVLAGGMALLIAFYLAARSGRLKKTNTETPGKPPLHNYAGVVSSDNNGVTVFIWVLAASMVAVAIGYVLYTSANGLGY